MRQVTLNGSPCDTHSGPHASRRALRAACAYTEAPLPLTAYHSKVQTVKHRWTNV